MKYVGVIGPAQNYFNQHNPITESVDEITFPVSSKIEQYNVNRAQNAILFYLLSYLSLIFYVGAFTLLYLNLMSDIELEKIKFEKLSKIGITKEEVKHQLNWETFILFFLPTILGIALAFLYLVVMSQDIGGLFNNWSVVGYFALMSFIYLLIQFVFYLYAKSKLFKKVWASIDVKK